MDKARWIDPDTHGWIVSPRTEVDWNEFIREYGAQHPGPLAKVVATVRDGGCRTVVIENRYVDSDFRSEFSAFWSLRFDSVPAFARRLHFFTAEISDEQLHNLPTDPGYLGYAVIRPLEQGPVGRTMVMPPPKLRNATLAVARDDVTLFGNRLTVEAAPFCQQDGEYFRCAHAAAWMCHYSAVKRRLVPRQPTAAFVAASPAILSAERALPSKGMSLHQLQAVFGAFDQPALFYGLGRLPQVAGVENPKPGTGADGKPLPPGKWDTRIFSVLCRYLNSGYPVFIATQDHGFAIVGWYRDGDWIRFIVNDDQRGPYGVIDSPFEDERGVWQALMVPLPPRVLLSAESAEIAGHRTLRAIGSVPNAAAKWAEVARGVSDKTVSVRTLLRDASDYKAELLDRGIGEDTVRLLRLARLPHYVWVVEAHDRDARKAGAPCVLAEVVIDSTSNDYGPRLDALLMSGVAVTYPPDGGRPQGAPNVTECWQSSLPLNVAEMPRRLQLAS